MKKWIVFSFVFFCLFLTDFVYSKEISPKTTLLFFYGEGCPHCEKERQFLSSLQKKYKFLEVKEYEISKNLDFFKEIAKKLKIKKFAVPVTVIEEKYFIGFYDEYSTGKEIETALIDCQKDFKKTQKEIFSVPKSIKVPFLGEIKFKNLSLPVLTILLGAVDGFNPCAMWVLILLISFLASMNDRKKMVLLGSLFVFTSAFVYFLFMVSWLNLFLFISFIPWIKKSIGAVAILASIFYLKDFFISKEGACKVTSSKQKKYISDKLAYFVSQKKYTIAAISIVFLAFFVNLIELICSIGLPTIYIQVLTLSALSTVEYYLYILLYIFIFMLDDLIVFLLAVFSLRLLDLKGGYSTYSRLIGGVVLFIIGILLIFKPAYLMFG